jgi:hypothetical protein
MRILLRGVIAAAGAMTREGKPSTQRRNPRLMDTSFDREA